MSDKRNVNPNFTRRQMAKVMGAGALLALSCPAVLRAQTQRPLVMVSHGGSFADVVRESIVGPFTRETGIPVQMVNTPDLPKVRAQVESGNVEWDIYDGSGPQIMAGSRAGFWADIDTSIVDTTKLVGGAGRDRVPMYVFCGGVAWNQNRHPEGQPKNFTDFWDIDSFPGSRAMRNRVSETLEAALLADGVSPAELYPLDLERGFAALDRIKPHVRKWFEQSPQMVTLIQSNEIDYIYAYPNRIRAAVESGIPLGFSFDQTLNAYNYLAVLKGARNEKAAMQYLAFALRPESQAAFAEQLSLVPVVREAQEMISDEARKWLPNLTNPNNAFINDEYWADNFQDLDRRFKEWILI